MKVRYDAASDTLSIVLLDSAPVADSDEEKPGVILDYDSEGNLVSLEVLDASTRTSDPRSIEYQHIASS
ncbi:MAG TPA: DUF2283 domain-containing protein [Chloroflexota bacterium]|jgi:uncharacterized protein YuzE|nr:DUF2283 domain-containing protein [Chloroflexota bacterium]